MRRSLFQESQSYGSRDGKSLLPDFIVVGAVKSGTTWLFDRLSSHPSIYIPTIKECRFFSCMPRDQRGGPAARYQNRGPRSLGGYLKLFEGAEQQIKGDISNDYFFHYGTAIYAIKDAYDKAGKTYPKIIIVLRNPYTRAFSLYAHAARLGSERKAFLDALYAEQQREKEGFTWVMRYCRAALSYEATRAYRAAFPDVFISVFEDLFSDKMLRDISRFLGIDGQPWTDTTSVSSLRSNTGFYRRYPTYGHYVLERLLHFLIHAGRRPVEKMVGSRFRGLDQVEMWLRTSLSVRVRFCTDAALVLRQSLAEDIEALADYLDDERVRNWVPPVEIG